MRIESLFSEIITLRLRKPLFMVDVACGFVLSLGVIVAAAWNERVYC
jgi:hypothetical protein